MDSGGGGAKPLTSEEEALRRNTDCVYFLASLLTCKKGMECEFRHSDGARLNPRDCWYWLNGNCLNPKCSFRHPPLDSLYGNPGISGPAVPPLHSAPSTQALAPQTPSAYNLNKQSVPCYYFQKGSCLKGDRCPFMHEPQPMGNPPSQPMAKPSASTANPPWSLKELEDIPAQQNGLKINGDQLLVPHLSANPVARAEAVPENVQEVMQSMPYHRHEALLTGTHPTKAPVSRVIDPSRPQNQPTLPLLEQFPNGQESSPGFDVLVDDNGEDSGDYHTEGDLGRKLVHGGRKLDHLADLADLAYQCSDYENYERGQFDQVPGYDLHEQSPKQYSQGLRNTFSNRVMDREYIAKKGVLQRCETTDQIDGSDLRHRLLKQRKLNSSRSASSLDDHGEYQRNEHYPEERYPRHGSQRDQQAYHQESSRRNRLEGRITIPRRSSPDRPRDMWSERERDGKRPRGRVSPAMPVSHQTRHHEIVSRRSVENFTAEVRNSRGKLMRREQAEDPLDFAGPKSLAELKGARVSENSQGLLAKQINASLTPEKQVGNQLSESSLQFEGPKTAILKRKRENFDGKGENYHGDKESDDGNSDMQPVTSHPAAISSEEPKGDKALDDDDDNEEGQICAEAEENLPAMEDNMINNMENQGLKNSERGEVESDNEAVEGGDAVEGWDMKMEEDDENTYQEEDEDLDDDDDDFARKVGLMFS